MTVYQLRGVHKSGEEWGFGDPVLPILYSTREKAERQKLIEINAYTYEGVCNWEFSVHPIEVE